MCLQKASTSQVVWIEDELERRTRASECRGCALDAGVCFRSNFCFACSSFAPTGSPRLFGVYFFFIYLFGTKVAAFGSSRLLGDASLEHHRRGVTAGVEVGGGSVELGDGGQLPL